MRGWLAVALGACHPGAASCGGVAPRWEATEQPFTVLATARVEGDELLVALETTGGAAMDDYSLDGARAERVMLGAIDGAVSCSQTFRPTLSGGRVDLRCPAPAPAVDRLPLSGTFVLLGRDGAEQGRLALPPEVLVIAGPASGR